MRTSCSPKGIERTTDPSGRVAERSRDSVLCERTERVRSTEGAEEPQHHGAERLPEQKPGVLSMRQDGSMQVSVILNTSYLLFSE